MLTFQKHPPDGYINKNHLNQTMFAIRVYSQHYQKNVSRPKSFNCVKIWWGRNDCRAAERRGVVAIIERKGWAQGKEGVDGEDTISFN